MKRLLSPLLFLLLLFIVVAEDAQSFRSFNQEALEQYRNDPEFDYSKEYAQSGSLITLLFAYVLNKLFAIFNASGAGWVVPWIFRLLLISLIVFVVYFILRNRYGPLFTRESKEHVPTGMVTQAEEKVDFDKLLQQATANSAYKLAIRYLFLRSLNELHKQGNLQIRQWKAPYDYLKELPVEKRPFFRELTELFEVTWYGEHPADESTYERGLMASKELDA